MTADLLAAIGAALGLDGSYPVQPPRQDADGFAISPGNRVLDGTVDHGSGRVGLVEKTIGDLSVGYVPVEITINVVEPGRPPLRAQLHSYNPYFGCSVHLMRFLGNALITVYTEKHWTMASRLVPTSPDQPLVKWAVTGWSLSVS